MAEKNAEIEQPIPVEWRSTIAEIVEDIRSHNLRSREVGAGEITVDQEDRDFIYQSVESYGDPLASLSSETWESSCCRWMGDHWHLLVDLCTVDEGVSDLVLFLDVVDRGGSHHFKVKSAHVP